MNVMQQQGRIYDNMAQYQLGALCSDGKIFLVFAYTWKKDVAKISKVQRAPCNVNPAWAITWLVGVTVVKQNVTSSLRYLKLQFSQFTQFSVLC